MHARTESIVFRQTLPQSYILRAKERKLVFKDMVRTLECPINRFACIRADAHTHAWTHTHARMHACRFGYSLWSYQNNAEYTPDRTENPAAMKQQTGAKVAEMIQSADVIDLSSTGLAFRLLNKAMRAHTMLPPNTFTGDHVVIMVPHLFSAAASAHLVLSGMEQRMLQIITALDSVDCVLHVICSGCNVTTDTNTAWISAPVHIYRTGSPFQQIDAMLATDPCLGSKITTTLNFVTQVTMELSQSTIKTLKMHGTVPTWSKSTPLASELVSRHLSVKLLSKTGLQNHAQFVITDDVHYVRAGTYARSSVPANRWRRGVAG